MSRRPRLAAVVAVLAAGAALAGAAPAQALDCAAFKTAVENAHNGDVISLDAGSTCNDTYTLPSDRPAPFAFTITSGGGTTTLDGSGKTGPIIFGEPTAGHQIDVTITDLTFRNGHTSGSGGAIELGAGDVSVLLHHDRFLANSAGSSGGAVWIQSTAGARSIDIRSSTFGDGTAAGANTAGIAGAIEAFAFGGGHVKLGGNTFDRNVATAETGAVHAGTTSAGTTTLTGNVIEHNKAGDSGGGATVSGPNVSLTFNHFLDNHVHDAKSDGAQGGALMARTSTPGTLTQERNRFEGNGVSHGSQPKFDIGGGGEWVLGYHLTSRWDRFVENSIQKANGGGHAEGAGLGIEGCAGPMPPATRIAERLVNAVVAGNIVGSGAHGSGVYAGGCSSGPVGLTVLDSTITANASNGSGPTGGLFGGSDDKLTMRNSIVTANSGKNLSGFGAGRKVSYSDVCSPKAPAGAGNFCKFPQLVNPTHGNVHEKADSPTINAGSNSGVPSTLKDDIDFEPRIQLHRVDMGADEWRDPFQGVVIVDQTVTVTNGKAKVRVECPAGTRGPCKGSLKLKRNKKTLGEADFSIESGKHPHVSVALNDLGKQQVAAAGTLAVLVRATAKDALGASRKSTGHVTLKKG